jgi:hypothetical protein
MDSISQLQQKIEYVRSSLNALVAQKSTTDPEVGRLSTCLDKLIVHYMRQTTNLNGQRGK